VVRVVLAPASAWAALVASVHLLALAAAVAFLPASAAAFVVAGLGLTGWAGVSGALVRGPYAVREIELRADGTAAFVDGDGEWREATVAGAAILGHRLAALRLDAAGRRRAVVLVPGAADPVAFRRTRVWTRWRLPPA
jgi:hypothetical protein